MNEYGIRRYERGDRDGFLSLYTSVFGTEKGDEWFAWKYEDNPYVDHVAILVATTEGEIVGARPFFALPVAIDGETDVVLQPGDTMVHPDHRREGLFTRMTERAIERYADDHPFFFNFPNHRVRPGYLELNWQIVSERTTYYRIEDPTRVTTARSDRAPVRVASRIGTPFVRSYYRARDLRSSTSGDISIRTERDPPADELAALYRTRVPEAIHAVRDERFYEWRFDNPDREYTAYIADGKTDDGEMESEAAIVTGTSTGSGLTTTKLTDVVPLEAAPERALVALFGRILTVHPETDLFCARTRGISGSVLRSFGFHADSIPPLSLLATQTTHVVRALDDWELNGTDITDPDNWLLTFAEEDTS